MGKVKQAHILLTAAHVVTHPTAHRPRQGAAAKADGKLTVVSCSTNATATSKRTMASPYLESVSATIPKKAMPLCLLQWGVTEYLCMS